MNIQPLIHKKWAISASVATFVLGTGVGYILGKRQRAIETIYVNVTEEPKQLNFFSEMSEREVSTELQDRIVALNDYRTTTHESTLHIPMVTPEEEAPGYVNVFATTDSTWDYEAELSTRTPDLPYVLHKDEFFNDEMGFTQSTVTYYQGDDMVADESDTQIYAYQKVLGELKFGHGSEDQNVVYIRNERLRLEWEVLLSTDHFSVAVLGNTIERKFEEADFKHSFERKFRGD